MAHRDRILFLDARDSFSNNITALLATLLDVDVFVLPIDSPLLDEKAESFEDDLRRELTHYAAVVCGPGPGSPTNERDVGLMRRIWELGEEDVLPALGICLGFQSLVASCGGAVRRLGQGLHGMVREMAHRGSQSREREGEADVFAGVGPFKATLYHSLCADVGQDGISPACWETARWQPSRPCPDLVPLAWVEEQREGGTERILMATRHGSRPFWGLQYHPESVCTEGEGHQVIRNWFREAVQWNQRGGRRINHDDSLLAGRATRQSLLSLTLDSKEPSEMPASWRSYGVGLQLHWRTVELPTKLTAPDVVEILGSRESEQMILDSSNACVPVTGSMADVRGRYSIIAMNVAESLRLEYRAGEDAATARFPCVTGEKTTELSARVPLEGYQSIWQLLAEFHETRRIGADDHLESPFLGGFMGYVSYEQGLYDIGVDLSDPRGHSRPDICLSWVTRSIVLDHKRGLLHVQHLAPLSTGEDWIGTAVTRLQGSHLWHRASCEGFGRQRSRRRPFHSQARARDPVSSKADVRTPNPSEYESKVKLCQEYIAAGQSYELCLTDQTTIITRPLRNGSEAPTPHQPAPLLRKRRCRDGIRSSWQLYRRLRARQPAPFASYIRLGGATLISSSPERFLQFERDGRCTMKPMKGTVRRSDAVQTLARAEELLHVPKEEAENLMIVDLVRHDLHGICGAGKVAVPHLMRVEEYQSVFQMITVVEGRLPSCEERARQHTGLDVLSASLPPGSMTGAPKRRSCEILRRIEQHRERGLYSGVVGYMCASGRGDWSVTIRSMFRWDDEQQQQPAADADGCGQETWHVGAGGAVTILSTPEGETEEMFTKLAGPLGVFVDSD